MTNPNADKVAKILALHVMRPEEVALQLDSAGLLVTPLHERALEACEALAKHYTHEFGNVFDHPLGMACNAGRESLALKEKAKGARWIAKNYSGSVWAIEREGALADAPVVMFQHFTKQQARRVAAALNEGDES